MFNEHDFLTYWNKITPDRLTCHSNPSNCNLTAKIRRMEGFSKRKKYSHIKMSMNNNLGLTYFILKNVV